MHKLIDEKYFALGVNLAWLDDQYGHDFGINEIMKHSSRAYDEQQHRDNIDAYFKDISLMGARIVRMYVFEGFEGLNFNQDNSVVGIDDALINNMAELLQIAKKYGLYLYICLIDPWSVSAHAQEHLQILNNIIAKEDVRKSFIDTALKLFVSDSRLKGDRIFAIDVMNEPEGMYTSVWRADIEQQDVLNFIRECAVAIHENSDYKVSCSFQQYQTLMDSKDALNELDFYDYHEYNDDGKLIPYSNLDLKKPCIIGACGQKHEAFNDKIQNNAVQEFLKNSWKNGYAGCLIWNYNYKGYEVDDADNRYSLIKSDGQRRAACNAVADFSRKHRKQMLP